MGKGRKMTADDVVYSFKRIVNPATASPGAWIFNNRIDTTNGFSAIDDSTFQLKLLRPFSPILGVLYNKYCSIVPKEVVQFYGKDFRSHPCGTGPFQFKSWEEGQSLILLKNDLYFERDETWQSLPYLDAVKVSFNDSRATEFLQFRQGELDFLNDIDPSFKDEVLNKKGQLRKDWEGKIELQKHAYLNTEYLGIVVDTANELVKQSPLRLKKIRQAINYGFDRKKLMFYLRNSIGTAAESGFVPAGLPSFDTGAVHGYHFDPDKARSLLQEAMYDKKGPAIKLLTIPIYADLGNFIARQLEEIGLKVEVEVIPKVCCWNKQHNQKLCFSEPAGLLIIPMQKITSVFFMVKIQHLPTTPVSKTHASMIFTRRPC
ncbi:MAG: ABC transporter substrate-binding protein [Chitinophagaceae bacterium]|nr:ABC transporter substrate-binding protein [Chitinophagaceae bacterium]